MTPCRRTILAIAAALSLGAFPRSESLHAQTLVLPTSLPVYLEDSHAGSFFYFAEELDLDTPHALVLIDDHSDASGIIDSDRIRDGLRRVASTEQRRDKLAEWRQRGAIQCFGWLEPLMPRPIDQVIWVPSPHLSEKQRTEKELSAREQIDGHQEAMPRADGLLASRYSVVDLEHLSAYLAKLPEELPVIASVDLDYFVNFPSHRQAEEIAATLRQVLTTHHLRALTFCISRPWLADDAEASLLITAALGEILKLDNLRLRMEPFADAGPDQSLKAQELLHRGQPVPRFDFAKADAPLRRLLTENRHRIEVRQEQVRWNELLDSWAEGGAAWRIAVDDHQAGADGFFRIQVGTTPGLRVVRENDGPPAQLIRWLVWRPESAICNVVPLSGGKGFADGATPRVRRQEQEVSTSDPALAAPWEKFAPLLDKAGWGDLELQAEITAGKQTTRTPRVHLRFFAYEGFRASLTEQFGLPYVFGSTWLSDGERTGPETGWGADCANFIIAGLRRQGHRVSWGNPVQLKSALTLVQEQASLKSPVKLGSGWLERGVVVHLGSHVAALLEDRPPLERLDGNDLVAHHLEGVPEAVPLRQLLATRPDYFGVWRVPDEPPAVKRILVGGDVMLGRSLGPRVCRGENPLTQLAKTLQAADCALVNLECAVTDKGQDAAKTFCFRAPTAAIDLLKSAGIDAVTLANNHACDAGAAGRDDMVRRLQKAKLGIAASPQDPALCLVDLGSCKAAFVGVNFIETAAPEESTLHRLLSAAHAAADCVIVLPHWGEEHTGEVTAAQRLWAQWFVAHGADAVIGSHPHHRQFQDTIAGRPVIFSLGNLVFDEGKAGSEFNRGSLAEISLSAEGTIVRVQTLQVTLTDEGIPQPASR